MLTGSQRHTHSDGVRLGAIEKGILRALAVEGSPLPRSAVVLSVFPELRRHTTLHARAAASNQAPRHVQRALVEATVSRAIASLERKGLVVRERRRPAGRTLVHGVGSAYELPEWEQAARAEEDLAAHASTRARYWRMLASRARQRADRIRSERSADLTTDERAMDLHVGSLIEERGDSPGGGRRSEAIPIAGIRHRQT